MGIWVDGKTERLELRQDSKKLRKFLGKWSRELRQTAEHNGRAIYSQVQMVTRAEGPGCLAAGHNWENEYLAPRVTCPPWR